MSTAVLGGIGLVSSLPLLLLSSDKGSALSPPQPQGLCEKTDVKTPGGSNTLRWWPGKVLVVGAARAKALRKLHAEGMARRLSGWN